MGTNYYAIRKSTEELKAQIIEAVQKDQLDRARQLIYSNEQTIHIGKSSAGWQFLFNHNDWKYFNQSLESLQQFLQEVEIEDEYGKRCSYDEFWGMVEAKKGGLDNKEYYTNWNKYNKDPLTGTPSPKPLYIPESYGQEIHFGLFFSDCTDFS